ncbi:MAG: PepSY-associated TM helix domain-containing protein [Bacteroidota bacterium]
MKLKGLGKRLYNITFHTHTVTGIVISAALFVIFYAGAFSLFREEIYKWENPSARHVYIEHDMNIDDLVATIQRDIPDVELTAITTIRGPHEAMPYWQFYGAEMHQDEGEEEPHSHRFAAYINSDLAEPVIKQDEPKTTVGSTLYRLHYFGQIPAGIHISGLVALFFLFATITGVLIHWRNMIDKLYAFTIKGSWKNIWANAHTVLGLLGLPFQIMYAITGALFGILIILLIPAAFILFGGDTAAVTAAVAPEAAIVTSKDSPEVEELASIETLVAETRERYPDYPISRIRLNNYGREDALALMYLDDEATLNGNGVVTYRIQTGEILAETSPIDKNYTESVYNLLTRLHFATYGGIVLKVVYFILALITCFMFISGVLLWQAARDKKTYTDKQRRFHHKVTKVNLAFCLSMFPAFALIFILNKVIPMELVGRVGAVNGAFFLGWLIMTLIGLRWNNYRRLNKNYLVMGAVLSLLVPIVNGVVTGDWFWSTLINGQVYVAAVDLFWLFASLTAFAIVNKIKRKEKINVVEAKEVMDKPQQAEKVAEPIVLGISNRAKLE